SMSAMPRKRRLAVNASSVAMGQEETWQSPCGSKVEVATGARRTNHCPNQLKSLHGEDRDKFTCRQHICCGAKKSSEEGIEHRLQPAPHDLIDNYPEGH